MTNDFRKALLHPDVVLWQSGLTGPLSFYGAIFYGVNTGLSGDPLFFVAMVTSFISVMSVGLILGARIGVIKRNILILKVLGNLGTLIAFSPVSVFWLYLSPLALIIFIFTQVGERYKIKDRIEKALGELE